MPYYAHSGLRDDRSDWQALSVHLTGVARLGGCLARPFGLEKAASAVGLFHDLGKYDPRFLRRLEDVDIRVDHSTAGAVVVRNLVREAAREGRASSPDVMMAELLAYCILGHHAGLPDWHNEFGHCFKRRIDNYGNTLDPVWKREVDCDLAGLMPEALLKRLMARARYRSFDLSVIGRILFSCLVDADFKDTERHYAAIEGWTPDREWPSLQDLLPSFIKRFDAHMARKAAEADDTGLNRLRRDILAHVRGKAGMAPGLFTLNVPTGGGKTLASLAFALEHAGIHGHRRIIYSIPFTSIIDQVADIFRGILGAQHILEHHASIDEDEGARKRMEGQKPASSRDRLKLAMEDWAAPVVVTTNVQFFESLFAARTARARKLHNIAGSIIILDEAQTIPRHLLKPCVRMLDALAIHFGCTIVLCTATQPALGRERPDGRQGFPEGLDLKGRELAPDPHDLAQRLRRARITLGGKMDNDALVAAITREPQALVIVNSRRHALDLYRQAQAAGLDGLVHLTTRQCAAHRREILAEARDRLPNGKPCRMIATSLIEAGVDVDFPRVWRAEAGLDSIVQAAGRCNRENKRSVEESVVTVFSTPDYTAPAEIRGLVGDMVRMAKDHEDLLSLAAIEAYFSEVYWRLGDSGLDREDLVGRFRIGKVDGPDFAYRTVAEKFRMIESALEPVIIPWDDRARKAVDDLSQPHMSSGTIARRLQTYVVQIPPKARDLLIRNGHAAFERPDLRGDQFAVLKNASLYKDIGLLWEDAEYLAAESQVI